eukprot:TRINITY_DN12765_c0_g1_i1.p1 TRINITY_DN12765_c0_g1~~TRINITY_DN12765_c0_g1_i1.p1  ORF type:complete len:951 (-),score=155.09 TRINITY_DN12765_c0_g1_i1:1452-4304(-)
MFRLLTKNVTRSLNFWFRGCTGRTISPITVLEKQRLSGTMPTMETYKLAMQAQIESNDVAGLSLLVRQMKADGCMPYAALVDATCAARNIDAGFEQLLAEMTTFRQQPDASPQTLVALQEAMTELTARVMAMLDKKSIEPTSPYTRELQLEMNAVGEAVERYRRMVAELIEMGKGAEMKPAHKILIHWYMPLVEEISTELRRIKSDESGQDRRNYGGYLLLLTPEKLAVIVLHEVIGMTLAAPEGVKFARLALAVGQSVRAEINLQRLKTDAKSYRYFVSEVAGRLSSHVVNRRAEKAFESADWGAKIEAKVGGSLIYFLLKSANVIAQNGKTEPAFKHEIRRLRRDQRVGFVSCHEQVQNVIEAGHSMQESLRLRLLPMLVKPKPWLAHNYGGYLHVNTSIMRTKGSKTQVELLRACDPTQVYEGLDALSATKWNVNPFVYEVMNEAWKRGGDIAELPPRSDLPLPPPLVAPSDPTDVSAREAFRNHQKELRKIQQKNRDRHSLRCDAVYKMQVAEEFLNDTFYFPHNIDFRGRAYPIPPHLHHVGSDICRGLLRFAEGKPIGEDGIRWLKIHLANLAGKDKLTFDGRVEFVDSSMKEIRECVRSPLDGSRWWTKADEPWQCLAVCNELVNVLDSPNPAAYLSSQPIHQDGSCNGLQHYAALGRDSLGASQVDLLPSDKPGDVYSAVADRVRVKVAADAERLDAHEHVALAKVLLPHITRKVVKQTVMTSVYGVTFVGARRQIAARLEEREGLTEEQIVSGSYYLTKLVLSSLGEIFSGAKTIMAWLNNCAKVISQTNLPVTWVTPLGLAVLQPYRRDGKSSVKTLVQSVVLAESSDSLPVSRARQKSAFPPNFVHSLDSTHMLMTALACRDEGLTFASVHDSYWTHACDVPVMNRLLRDQFVLLHGQPILEHLHQSFVDRFPQLESPPLPARGDLRLTDVMNSQYFFD